MKVRVRYFAMLRDAAGVAFEDVAGDFASPAELWAHLAGRRAFPLGPAEVRVSVNAVYVSFDAALRDGDEVAFIPPVSGG